MVFVLHTGESLLYVLCIKHYLNTCKRQHDCNLSHPCTHHVLCSVNHPIHCIIKRKLRTGTSRVLEVFSCRFCLCSFLPPLLIVCGASACIPTLALRDWEGTSSGIAQDLMSCGVQGFSVQTTNLQKITQKPTYQQVVHLLMDLVHDNQLGCRVQAQGDIPHKGEPFRHGSRAGGRERDLSLGVKLALARHGKATVLQGKHTIKYAGHLFTLTFEARLTWKARQANESMD
eukprot:1161663-Pelagomonas_calceolata.AAC.2